MKDQKFLPKIYVLGSTNSGKSSFINSLLYKSKKYKKEKNQDNIYREKFNILTESAAPGTTLEMVTVE